MLVNDLLLLKQELIEILRGIDDRKERGMPDPEWIVDRLILASRRITTLIREAEAKQNQIAKP